MNSNAPIARRVAVLAAVILGLGILLLAALYPREPDAEAPPDRTPAPEGPGSRATTPPGARLDECLARVRQTLGGDPEAVRALGPELLAGDIGPGLLRARIELDLALSSPEPESAVAALRILVAAARNGGPEVRARLENSVLRNSWSRTIEDPSASVRAGAAALLGEIGSVPARARLVPLLEDPDADVRLAAVGAYGPLADEAARRGSPGAMTGGSPRVRAAIIRALAENPRLAGPDAAVAVGRALAEGGTAERLDALHYVTLRRDRTLLPLVTPLLTDPLPEIREAAAETVWWIGDRQGSSTPR